MSRYTGSKCRLCRREGMKLFLKGARCETQKCSFLKKGYPPGMHGKGFFGRIKEYARQLREKQKARRTFGISEKQMYNYYGLARRAREATDVGLLTLLETRLDNVIYRGGLADSRAQGRQFTSHGTFALNGKKVTVPSVSVKEGDKITLKNKSHAFFSDFQKKKIKTPSWLKLDQKSPCLEVVNLPGKDDLEMSINSGAIVEFYSR